MRFIRAAGENLLSLIAGQMINFETNRKIFVNGTFTSQDEYEPNQTINIDGVKIIIKPVFGLVYVDLSEIGDYENWVKLLAKRVKLLEELHLNILSKYMQNHIQVETGAVGFTSLKIKIATNGTKTLHETSFCRDKSTRVIYSCNAASLQSMYERIGIAKFTWLVYPIKKLIDTITNSVTNPDVNGGILSYFTLVYDPKYIISNKQDPSQDTIFRDITITDIKYVNKIIPIFTDGELKLENLVKRTKTEPTQHTPGLTSLVNNMFSMKTLVLLLGKPSIQILRHPCYIPGLNANPGFKLMYCKKRFGAIELIRQLGTLYLDPIKDYFNDMFHIPIFPLTKEVHNIEYKDVQISNTHDNTKCNKCNTPLYDKIYVTFDTVDSPICKAYCSVCMHSRYENEFIIALTAPDTCTMLCDLPAIIAITTYPRNYNHVIDLVSNDNIKDILRAMYSINNMIIDKYQTPEMVFLNCSPAMITNRELDSTVYVGFNNINNYIEYFEPYIDQYMPSSEVFTTNYNYIMPKVIHFPITFVNADV